MREIIEIECLRLASDGAGVGYDQGKATFISGLLPGERGKAEITEKKKTWQRAKLIFLENKAKERVIPPCRVFGVCGGCQLQHLNYEETLKWKERWVVDVLKRVGKIDMERVEVRPTIGMQVPWRYRNKVCLHRSATGELGYFQDKSRKTVEFPDCLLMSESMNEWVRFAQEFLCSLTGKCPDSGSSPINFSRLRESEQGVSSLRNITLRENTKGEGMLIFEALSKEHFPTQDFNALVQSLVSSLQAASSTNSKIVSVWGVNVKGAPELWWGQEHLNEEILGLKFKVSPFAFLQVNPIQTRKLYTTALEWAEIHKESRVWDLYSGIGTITLALAQEAQKVWGIEENPYAVKDAWVNAELNGMKNIEFLQGKVEDVLRQVPESPDVVVLDPPRAGVHRRVLERLIEVRPERLVYVSCDPGTLARDLGIMQESGYQVRKVQPVDMFPWTQHVESIIMMTYSVQKGK